MLRWCRWWRSSIYALPEDGFEVTEHSPLAPTSPYARTKLMMETCLRDIAAATDLRAVILRYFNPIGSDPDLTCGVYVREPSHVLGQLVMTARGPDLAQVSAHRRSGDQGQGVA